MIPETGDEKRPLRPLSAEAMRQLLAAGLVVTVGLETPHLIIAPDPQPVVRVWRLDRTDEHAHGDYAGFVALQLSRAISVSTSTGIAGPVATERIGDSRVRLTYWAGATPQTAEVWFARDGGVKGSGP